jgi:hypothetical protein
LVKEVFSSFYQSLAAFFSAQVYAEEKIRAKRNLSAEV